MSNLPTSLPPVEDQTVTVKAQLAACPAGPNGVLVTAHPLNPVGSIVRIGDTNVSATRGHPFIPGASYTFGIANANGLYAISETGVAVKVCVGPV
jgi:hypothetical protein